jgi:ATP-dependent Lon protease
MAMSDSTDLFFTIPDAKPDADGLIELAVVPLRDFILFPNMLAPLSIRHSKMITTIETAQREGQTVIGVAQLDPETADPRPGELFSWGTEMACGQLIELPDESYNVLVQGRRRVEIVEYTSDGPFLRARARPHIPEPVLPVDSDALVRVILDLFKQVVEFGDVASEEAYIYALNIKEPGWLADMVASMLNISLDDRQLLLETTDVLERLRQVSLYLGRELEVLELESRIHAQAEDAINNVQREVYLREKMRAIQSELGEMDPFQQELSDLRDQIVEARMPEEVYEKAMKELGRLAMMPPMAPEVGIIRTYLDWLVELPWWRTSEDNLDIAHAAEVLDAEHFGLEKAKERILEHIAVRQLAPDRMKSPILCFVGPPGTGKTSLGQSIANALGREFVRVSLGGVRDEAEIRGHRRTYIGALPGRILQTMRRVTTVNPIFMMDEVDKLGADFRGDPAAALLEVLDPEQNHAYGDHYLDLPYDLSKVFFITTANRLDPIPAPLLDRMEVIEFPGYTEDDKLSIAKRFLAPRQLEQHGLETSGLTLDEATLLAIMREYTYEAGVRNLEREIANVCRKVARRIAEGKPVPRVTPDNLFKLLGPPKRLRPNLLEEEDEVGVATGVAWTPAGGDIMAVEVTLMPGKGDVIITGQLGDVMRESAQAAMSYTRANAERFGIPADDFEKCDVHIHLPEGAIHKDGPSAGITMCVALVSAFTKRKVHRSVAMTGEITLRGRVLPVGGIREKVLSAYRAGVRRMVLPKRNEKDLSEISKEVTDAMELVLVTRLDPVLEVALHALPAAPRRSGRRTSSSPQPPARA